jgi:NADPH:quinone reductase-like Zn-dependent oxidoreductase
LYKYQQVRSQTVRLITVTTTLAILTSANNSTVTHRPVERNTHSLSEAQIIIFSMASNSAAWLPAAKAASFEVRSAPLWTPAEGEILVKNGAVAINPVDGSLQTFAWFPMQYPTILGQDVAGEVVAVGDGVTRFKIGDRVLGQALGMTTQRDQDHAFQQYTIIKSHMASQLPASISNQSAAVIPLGCSTAACGLFQQEPYLGLDLPSEARSSPIANKGTLLVWGGSSSVGTNGIQLAVAAGYDVIATASPKNFEYVKTLGASQVYDYSNADIEQELVQGLSGRTLVGVLDCIGGNATINSSNVLQKVAGSGRIATTKGASDYTPPDGIVIARIFGTTLADNGVGKAIYEDFLPWALSRGTFVPSPVPEVTGHGLDAIQDAVNLVMKGVSAKKLVVTL